MDIVLFYMVYPQRCQILVDIYEIIVVIVLFYMVYPQSHFLPTVCDICILQTKINRLKGGI